MTVKTRWFMAVLCVLLVAAFFIYLGSMKWLKVKEVKIKYSHLPDKIDGIRILHISDLHSYGSTANGMKMNVDIWKHIEGLEFDFAVITGDMTVTEYSQLEPHMKGLQKLAERTKVFFVDGNHDRYYYDQLTADFEAIGITVLDNETVTLYGGALELTGYRDYNYLHKTGNLHIAEDMAFGGSGNTFTVALYHQPQFYDYIPDDKKSDLSICGHTHGGQVRLPFFPTLYAPEQGVFPKYGDGVYDFDGKKMYISRGIGTTVFPVRFFNRPEIAVIEIIKE